MGAYRDYTGKILNGVRVIERASDRKSSVPYWRCICTCGAELVVRRDHLESGQLCRKCGLDKADKARLANPRPVKHGLTKTQEYWIWAGMKSRCGNSKNPNYPNYGGRGIRVCDKWNADFMAFLNDVGPRPSPGHSLDRIDNDLGYQPGNVKWATRSEQQNNRRANRIVEYDGRRMTLCQAIKASGLSNSAVRNRLYNGWSVERALSEPIKVKR